MLLLFFQCPSSEDEWRQVASDYYTRWNFPNCLGSLDGKHVIIRRPVCSGSTFFNYKHSFSIILLALVDAHYRFLFINVGAQGRCADAGVFKDCELNKALLDNTVHVPDACNLPGTDQVFPYVVVADDAFPLREGIMKPFPHRNLEGKQRIFNYRLSRARRCVENAFGIMASKFRVYLNHMCIAPDKVDKVVLATCVLHNMMRTISPKKYGPQKDAMQAYEQNNIPGAVARSRRSATFSGKYWRDVLCNYFNSPVGAVPWQ
jgi:hypothetical protein